LIAIGDTVESKMPQDRTRNETYLLRVTAEEKRAFEEAAELAGLQVAGWLRMVARRSHQPGGCEPGSRDDVAAGGCGNATHARAHHHDQSGSSD
jgi:hypothetical protein